MRVDGLIYTATSQPKHHRAPCASGTWHTTSHRQQAGAWQWQRQGGLKTRGWGYSSGSHIVKRIMQNGGHTKWRACRSCSEKRIESVLYIFTMMTSRPRRQCRKDLVSKRMVRGRLLIYMCCIRLHGAHLFPSGSRMGTATRLELPVNPPGACFPLMVGNNANKSTNPSPITTSPGRLPEGSDATLESDDPRRSDGGGGVGGGAGGGRRGRYKSCSAKNAFELVV